jgi:hypothetical protein
MDNFLYRVLNKKSKRVVKFRSPFVFELNTISGQKNKNTQQVAPETFEESNQFEQLNIQNA